MSQTMTDVLVPFKQVFAIVRVKDMDAFAAACELNNLGLRIDSVLSRTKVVMGWCVESVVEKIQALDFVDNVDLEESK